MCTIFSFRHWHLGCYRYWSCAHVYHTCRSFHYFCFWARTGLCFGTWALLVSCSHPVLIYGSSDNIGSKYSLIYYYYWCYCRSSRCVFDCPWASTRCLSYRCVICSDLLVLVAGLLDTAGMLFSYVFTIRMFMGLLLAIIGFYLDSPIAVFLLFPISPLFCF